MKLYLRSHGWIYEGDWLKNLRHGYGVLSKASEDGSMFKVYAGGWVKGRKSGYGSNWYKDGSYYEGTFRKGERNGCGQIWYKCGGYYRGMWLNDRYHGEGMLVQGFSPLFTKERVYVRSNAAPTNKRNLAKQKSSFSFPKLSYTKRYVLFGYPLTRLYV